MLICSGCQKNVPVFIRFFLQPLMPQFLHSEHYYGKRYKFHFESATGCDTQNWGSVVRMFKFLMFPADIGFKMSNLYVDMQWLSKKRSGIQTFFSTTTRAALPYVGTLLGKAV